ncbi:unnamed protein product [Polarella glacialis]|uniref:Uncharacterized protein n=1 Tax=Polarella glacialis TaxID=89957 RepID=A0A813DEC0_POLGL|nr:unnamed protein product [Polarella glacialis]
MAKAMKKKAVASSAKKPFAKARLSSKRKGFVAQKSERGSGLKFKLETFATVSKFLPGTKIKYGPNRKRPDSKSYFRYAAYMKAKTVGESLKLGAKIADFLWELERGDYKVVGGVRTEAQEVAAIGRPAFEKAKGAFDHFTGPNGLSMKIDDPRAVEELKREEQWRSQKIRRCEALAKVMGLKVETSEEIEVFQESADIRLQRRVADKLAEQKLDGAKGKKITDRDVEEVLQNWGFCQNTGRLNVMRPGLRYVYSDTIGAIRRRTGGFGITPPTKRYPNFPRLLCKWLTDNKPNSGCKFVCTAININANYAGRRHRDNNNEGPSVIRAFGKFKGGKLFYWPGDVKNKDRPKVEELKQKDSVVCDLHKTTKVFDGNRAHEVESFTGERYSIVFFTARGYGKLNADDVKFAKKAAGFPWPTKQELVKLKKATKTA